MKSLIKKELEIPTERIMKNSLDIGLFNFHVNLLICHYNLDLEFKNKPIFNLFILILKNIEYMSHVYH